MPETRSNPYVGPKPFEAGEPLFGRDREALELRYLLTAERIVLLYSPSGAGKSSLVNAGLLPRLRDNFEICGPTRVNSEPPRGVANRYVWSAISGLSKSPVATDATWKEYLASRKEQANPLLVFDQFEEILRIDPAGTAAKRDFFEQTGEMLRDPGIWALFIIREDYLAPLDPYARLIPTHFQNRFRLDRLTRAGAADAIEKPTRGRSEGYAPGVVNTLVGNLAKVKVAQIDGKVREEDGDYVEPVQLQVVCFDLWNRMLDAGRTTIAEENVGDVKDALANYYDNCVSAAAGEDKLIERRIRDWFSDKLITADGVRNEVRQEPDGSSGGLPGALVQKLMDTYLVRQEPRGSSIWYELAHDRLVEPVRSSNAAWLETNIERFQKYAAQWARESHPEGLLFLGKDLAQGLAWAAGHDELLQPVDREFLAASAKKQAALDREARQTQKLKWWLRIAVTAAVLAIGFGAYATVQTRRAREEQLAANAGLAADDDATVAAYLGYRAARMGAPLPTGLESMLSGIMASPTTYLVLRGSSVKSIAWSPDGKRFATAENDTVHILDAETGSLLREVRGHAGAVMCVAWSPDGRTIASGGADKTIRLWDAASGNALRTLEGHDGGVTSIAWSPDGKTIASASRDKTVRLWSAAAGEALRTIEGHAGAVSSVVWSHDGSSLASGDDKAVNVWSAATGQLLRKEAQLAPVLSVAWSPDSSRLAVAHSDATISLYIAGTTGAQTLHGHKGAVRQLGWSADGKTLASAGDDRIVRFWDAEGKQLPPLHGHSSGILSIAWSADGKRLATASEDKELRVWDIGEVGSLRALTGHKGGVSSIAWSPDGNTLATSSDDSSIRLWDPATGATRRSLAGHRDGVETVAWRPDGGMLASGGRDRTIRLWNPADGKLVRTIDAHAAAVRSVAWAPDGRILASASEDNTVKLWDPATGNLIRAVPGFGEKGVANAAVRSVAWSPDGKSLAFASSNTVGLLNVARGEIFRKLQGHTEFVYNAIWSPDGKDLLSVGDDGRIIEWNPATGMIEHQLDLNHDRVRNVAASPDGIGLAFATLGNLAVLDANTGDFSRNLNVPNEDFRAVAYSPDGRTLAAGGAGQIIHLWPGNAATLLDQVRYRIRFFTLRPDDCRHFFRTATCSRLK